MVEKNRSNQMKNLLPRSGNITHHSALAERPTGKHLKRFASPAFELLALCLALSGPLASNLCRGQETLPLEPLPQPGATLTTDQSDYAPGTTATITGSGFQPSEPVTLQVLHADGTPSTGADHEPWLVTADRNGNFQTTWHVCTDDCVGSTLLLSASGSSGDSAEVLFTDFTSSPVIPSASLALAWGY